MQIDLNSILNSVDDTEDYGEEIWESPLDGEPVLTPSISNLFKRADDLKGANDKPVEIVHDLIHTKSLTSLLGPSKVGKSQLALQLAFCVQNGLRFLDYETTKADVIYVDFEHQDYEILERIDKLRSHFKKPDALSPYILRIDGNTIYNEDSLMEICDNCRMFVQNHPTVKLVIFDSFSYFVPGDYNDPVNAKTYLDLLKYLSRDERDIAVAYTQISSKTSYGSPEDIIGGSGGNSIHRKLADITFTLAPKKESKNLYSINILNGRRREVTAQYDKETDYVFNFKYDKETDYVFNFKREEEI